MEKKSKIGFSLIELSIVILIIGLLILGVSKGSRIISEARLRSARALTAGSPVNSTPDIVLWVDSTSEKSFNASEAINGGTLTVWNDLNPQTTTKNNATGNGLPTYTSNVLSGLPVVRFEDDDGSNDFFTFDGSAMANSNYTVFAVAAKRAEQTYNPILGGTSNTPFNNFQVMYAATTVFRVAHHFDGTPGVDYIDNPIAAYTTPKYQIHSATFNRDIGRYYFENGVQKGFVNSAAAKTPLGSWPGAAIGRLAVVSAYFDGDIAEIILFNRNLTTSERQAIEKYLSQKWGIKLN